jgi:hypothetical protein
VSEIDGDRREALLPKKVEWTQIRSLNWEIFDGLQKKLLPTFQPNG